MKRGVMTGAVAAVLVAVSVAPADGQWRGQRDRNERAYDRVKASPAVGFALIGADPVGEMGQLVDGGLGGQIFGTVPLDRAGHFRIRADAGLMIYGHERQRLCFSVPIGCRIETDLTTTNSIAFGGLGPELVLLTGGFQPYVNGSVGFSYFVTNSSLSGANDYDDFGNTTNYDDLVMAWRAGGGLRFRVADGRRPLWIDLGVERHENGLADYLTEGDIADHADGSITLFPTRSEANLVAFRVGMTVGMGRSYDNDRRDRDDHKDRRRRHRR